MLDGLQRTCVFYPDDQRLSRYAWHIGTHDVGANKFLQSSIPHKVQLCHNVFKDLGPTADWCGVVRHLVQMYGLRKERDIRRWVTVAR